MMNDEWILKSLKVCFYLKYSLFCCHSLLILKVFIEDEKNIRKTKIENAKKNMKYWEAADGQNTATTKMAYSIVFETFRKEKEVKKQALTATTMERTINNLKWKYFRFCLSFSTKPFENNETAMPKLNWKHNVKIVWTENE